MQMTAEQALQQAIAAHQSGKLQDAEALYRAILQADPKHPDANHNLGVLAVSLNQPKAGIPFLKTALEANPKQGQFWISYINALIKDDQIGLAQSILAQGKKLGLSGEKVDLLTQQLDPRVSKDPSPSDLNALLALYQSGDFHSAKQSSTAITQKFPNHQFGWKVLGAALKQLGEISEAVIAHQRAAELAPKDAEIHYNLGLILTDLGRLEDAEASFKRAIALKPGFPEAHRNLGRTRLNLRKFADAEASYRTAVKLKPDHAESYINLGVALQALGKTVEAEASYRKAIAVTPDLADAHYNLGVVLNAVGRQEEAADSYRTAIRLKPDYAEAHCNLGITLKELKHLKDAAECYERAIALKPDFAEAHYNFGITQKELGRVESAEASYRRAIALKPEFAEAYNNLGAALQELGRFEDAEASYRAALALTPDSPEALMDFSEDRQYANKLQEAKLHLARVLEIDPQDHGLRAAVDLSMYKFLDDDLPGSRELLTSSSMIVERQDFESFKNAVSYWLYLDRLVAWHERRSASDIEGVPDQTCYVIGESHALASHNIAINKSGQTLLCRSALVKGCKQWHLGNSRKNKYKQKFELIFNSIPQSSNVLLAFGEIDCRIHEGIIYTKNKDKHKMATQIISDTVKHYIEYISQILSLHSHRVTIQGVPCPNIDTTLISMHDVTELIDVIREFNAVLRDESRAMGFCFLDVHALTDRGDGFSNGIWHIDQHHLSPDGMLEAWRRLR